MKKEFLNWGGYMYLLIKRLIFFLPLIISLTVSCRRDEMLDIRNTEYISFKFSDEGLSASGTVTKGSCDTLSYEITDWDCTGEESDSDVQTKGILTETLSGDVGVFADVASTTAMSNAKHTVNGSELVSDTKVLWKNYTSGTMKILSYAPYKEGITAGTDDSGRFFSYTVADAVSEQEDLLLASASRECTDRTAIPLAFKHGLTAIQFRMGFACKVKNITISNVKNSGRFYLDGTTPSGSATYTLSYGDGKDVRRDSIVNKGNEMMILMPQSFDSDSQTISITYHNGTKDTTITAKLNGTAWPVGKKVTYTLKKNTTGVEYIYFDLYAGDIVITNTTYTGHIFVDKADSIVTGAHKESNKYYIYHSASDTYTGTNESIKWKNTGYKSVADFKNRANVKPRIPQYSEITVGGKSWGEYITNNTNPADVLNAWKRKAGTQTEENVYNYNRILITGDSYFDVTIDRVYSRYFPYLKRTKSETEFKSIAVSSESMEKYGGITIGAPDLTSVNKDDWKREYKEKVTLRLKGNNYFSRISYSKPVKSKADGYLHITSEQGDGIAEGTLTVTLPELREAYNTTYWNFSRCALIGGGNPGGGDNTKRQVSGLEFNGGIVYVGLEEISGSKWESNYNLMTCIGAVNSSAKITINGGILTSVAYGPGSAIGGGAGWQDVGGNGDVTINGGTVYAYCFGVLNTDSGSPVKGTAIGGGSSGEKIGKKGTVTINGGNIYAYSTGGAAVGGGASALVGGGDAIITMKGGNLYAKSLPGSIGDYSVDAGTAIGGGGAGIISGNGGLDSMTITAGRIIAGSVGGGSCANSTGKIGRAVVNISGGETSAQFLLVKDKSALTDNIFTMSGGSIRNSSTYDTEYKKVHKHGGAVYMESGTCTVSGGTIEKCTADTAGAVYMNGGEFEMTGGTISNCSATTHGGAVYIDGGNATVRGGTIQKNIASKGNGGGVYVSAGDFKMPDGSTGQINNNSADANPTTHQFGNGGGIYVRSTTKNVNVDLIGGEVQYNAADRNGGGLCVDMSGSTCTATIKIGKDNGPHNKPYIAANSAALSGGGMAVEGSGSNIYIYSGTVKGNVSAYVKNEDIRNDGGMVDLVGKNSPGVVDHVDVNYKTITFYANNNMDPEPYDEQRVVTSTNSPLTPTATALAFEKEFYTKVSWNTKRDGSGVTYNLNGTGEVMNITTDLSLYAQWVENN